MIHELNLNHDLTIYYLCRVTQTTFVRIIISTNPQKIIFVEIILQLERKIISTNPQKIVFVRILSTCFNLEVPITQLFPKHDLHITPLKVTE